MPKSPLSTEILREAAAAEERYRVALAWVENHRTHGGQAPKVTVSWDAGSALDGYQIVRKVIEEGVQSALRQSIEDALMHLRAVAEAKRRTAQRHLNEIEG